MAIKVGGTTVVDDSRQLSNIASIDATTVTALGNAGIGGVTKVSLPITETVSSGDSMQLNSDGSIDKVVEVIANTTEDASVSRLQITSGTYAGATKQSIKFVPNDPDRFVIFYQDTDNSSYPTAVVGSISGTTVTLGTPTVLGTHQMGYDGIDFDFDPNDPSTMVFGYYDSSNLNSRLTTATISGTTITASNSHTNFLPSPERAEWISIKFLPGSSNTGEFVIGYKNASGGDRLYVKHVTLSSGSFTLGSALDLGGGTYYGYVAEIAFNPSDATKFFVGKVEFNGSTQEQAYGQMVSISGSTLTAGTRVPMRDSGGSTFAVNMVNAAYDSASGHFVMVARDSATVNKYLWAGGFSVSGTTVTRVSNATQIDSDYSAASSTGFDWDTSYDSGRGFVAYIKSNYHKIAILSYNSSTGAFTVTTTHTETANQYSVNFTNGAMSKNGEGIFVSGFPAQTTRVINLGQIQVSVPTSNLDTAKMHGIAQEAGINGDSIDIAFGGIDETQTGLTPGSAHYIQSDGTITTTSTSAKKIGRAITSTKLLIDSVQ
jgi:hypothetical protein